MESMLGSCLERKKIYSVEIDGQAWIGWNNPAD
jgi:hypothetical protein